MNGANFDTLIMTLIPREDTANILVKVEFVQIIFLTVMSKVLISEDVVAQA
jgi:hypothetical protein